MTLKYTQFRVWGVGQFPVDMLRYDQCFPRREEDVQRIRESFNWRSSNTECEVMLGTFHRNEGQAIQRARWASFGWRVVEESITTVDL